MVRCCCCIYKPWVAYIYISLIHLVLAAKYCPLILDAYMTDGIPGLQAMLLFNQVMAGVSFLGGLACVEVLLLGHRFFIYLSKLSMMGIACGASYGLFIMWYSPIEFQTIFGEDLPIYDPLEKIVFSFMWFMVTIILMHISLYIEDYYQEELDKQEEAEKQRELKLEKSLEVRDADDEDRSRDMLNQY